MSLEKMRKRIRKAKKRNASDLDLSGLGLSELPSELWELTNLTTLDLSFNGLETLPPEIGKLINLRTLDLRHNALATLPPEIGKLTSLTVLDLWKNDLTTLPPEIGELTRLTVLDLRYNSLAALPHGIVELTSLKALGLSKNHLTALPPEIGKLTSLTTLDLWKNGLTALPPEIGKLTKLRTLDLSYNALATLPPEIGKLVNLTVLYLWDNGLETLPPEIGKLTNLSELNLWDNGLTALPSGIVKLANLAMLFVDGNPLEKPPLDVAKRGIGAIRDYFRHEAVGGAAGPRPAIPKSKSPAVATRMKRDHMGHYRCENCGKPIKVGGKHAGNKYKCPSCGNSGILPGEPRRNRKYKATELTGSRQAVRALGWSLSRRSIFKIVAAAGIGILVLCAIAISIYLVGRSGAPHDFSVEVSESNREMKFSFDDGTGMDFAFIPAGKFLQGSPNTEIGRDQDEGPRREVTISKPFYMGIYEVTQAQWYAVMGTEPWDGKIYTKSGDSSAAGWISWDDAGRFCEILSKKTGRKVMLPSEAQWEYACRAGGETAYSFGNNPSDLGHYAWYDVNTYKKDEAYAHSAGRKNANASGLYDMHGNVWEWCSDWYDADSYKNVKAVDPKGPATGHYRVLRGGSWRFGPRYCRTADRDKDFPGLHSRSYYGFRVVVESASDAD
ncbi:MAG: SUMF1/EgtB/PvdO family nonheme iron enzyme [Phycisphaerae bacterium]|nr:SUMF1/EgtB/PvdO family nonheme iron enzyme [Phycisphaerae bacterium]